MNNFIFYAIYSIVLAGLLALGVFILENYGLKNMIYYLAVIGFFSITITMSFKLFGPR